MFKVCSSVFICWLSGIALVYGGDFEDYNAGGTVRISEDYYFGSAFLRSNPITEFCLKRIPRYICKIPCFKNHICVDGKCKCLDEYALNISPKDPIDDDGEAFVDFTSRFQYEGKHHTYCSNVMRKPLVSYEPKPALRHHIAHFCPDLDVARDCIKQCMQIGKPAFCGKDHVCYCGHKYNSHSKDKKQDSEAIYAQFKDMYEKYFGPGYKPKNNKIINDTQEYIIDG